MLINVSFQANNDENINPKNISIIKLPKDIIDNIEVIQQKFFDWLYDESNNHGYWIEMNGIKGCSYDISAFVEWLNTNILNKEKAEIIKQYVDKVDTNLPTIFF